MATPNESKSKPAQGPAAPTNGGAELDRGGRDTGTPGPVGEGSAEIARQDGGRIDAQHGDELLKQAK